MKYFVINHKIVLILIPVIGLVMHWHIMKLELIGIHVWRQTQTQTVINNFANEDFNIFHPKYNTNPDTDRIMRMEFPVMQWIFAAFYKLFGNHIFISRILTFVIGIFSVFGIYFLLRNIFGNTTLAVIGAWAFNFSPEFYYYTVNPLPDNFALCCSIWFAALFFDWIRNKKYVTLIFSFLFLLLATLAKLPFMLYGILPVAYVALDLKRNGGKLLQRNLVVLSLLIVLLLPALIWYISVIPTWTGNGIVSGIADNKLGALEILDILQFILISTLPELLINYGSLLFFIAGTGFLFKNRVYKKEYFPVFAAWGIAILFYLFFELNMITKIHDYYLFPFMPLLFILVAYGAWQLILMKKRYLRYVVILSLFILPFTAYLRTISRWNTDSPGFNVDFYRNKDELRALVKKDDYCVIGSDISHFILPYYIDKKCWVFDNGTLAPEQLQAWIEKGAKYLYTDCAIDSIPAIRAQLGGKIYDKNTIRVYMLKSR